MRVYVNIKQAGKRRPVLEKKEYSMDPGIRTLREILTFFTLAEAEKFSRKDEESWFLYDDEEALGDTASEGKVGFGYRHDGKKIDPAEAVRRTLESFGDGLVRVFLNDEELTELDTVNEIKEDDVFTFVRFTFLTGRMW